MTKRTKKKTRRRVPAKKTTALALRPKVKRGVVLDEKPTDRSVVDGSFRLDALGLVELKATPKEEIVLAREPRPIDIMIKPTGQAYISHPVYTRWLNEAFTRGGWMLVPVGKPALIEKTVVCPYILYVHQRPVAFAQGEQEFHASNRDQTYGDALESTYASALRRCCKHLGIALELWDRRWCLRWRSEHATQVTVDVRRKNDAGEWQTESVTQWRRKDDPPLKGETRRGEARRPDAPVEHADIDKPISAAKRERFWRIARRVGRKDDEIKAWLLAAFNLKATTDITNRHYDQIVRVLESPGPLPLTREPGQEG